MKIEDEDSNIVMPEDLPKDANIIDGLSDEAIDGFYSIVKGMGMLFDMPIDTRMKILNNLDDLRKKDYDKFEGVVLYIMATRNKMFADIYCCFEDMAKYAEDVIKGEIKE